MAHVGPHVKLKHNRAVLEPAAPALPHFTTNLQQTKNDTTNVVNNIIVVSS